MYHVCHGLGSFAREEGSFLAQGLGVWRIWRSIVVASVSKSESHGARLAMAKNQGRLESWLVNLPPPGHVPPSEIRPY